MFIILQECSKRPAVVGRNMATQMRTCFLVALVLN